MRQTYLVCVVRDSTHRQNPCRYRWSFAMMAQTGAAIVLSALAGISAGLRRCFAAADLNGGPIVVRKLVDHRVSVEIDV